jgi:hypothetical protein
VSASLRAAAWWRSQLSGQQQGARRQASQHQHAQGLNRGEYAAEAMRPQRSRPRPRERARDVREVVRDVLRPPE